MPKGYFTPFTLEQEQKIKDEYLLKSVKSLAKEVGATHGRIMRFLKKNGLEIPKKLIEQRKKDSYYKPGRIPENKGMKQTEYMSPAAIEKTKSTRFKKGHIPHNARGFKNGDISIRKESDGSRSYQYIRISKNKWKLLHHYLWEKVNGKVPEGYCLSFKDGNSFNCELSNLELITRTENMYRNSKYKYPKEIISSLVLRKQIEHKLKSLQNG